MEEERNKLPLYSGVAESSARFFFTQKTARAEIALRRMFGKGEAEATVLNKGYNRLTIVAQNAVKALEDFEKEKLGMSEETKS